MILKSLENIESRFEFFPLAKFGKRDAVESSLTSGLNFASGDSKVEKFKLDVFKMSGDRFFDKFNLSLLIIGNKLNVPL